MSLKKNQIQYQCKECFNTDPALFIEDDKVADVVCMRCGVVAGRLVSEISEWRDFEEDEGASKSRVGAATNIYSGGNLSTQIGHHNKGGDRLAPRGSIARNHSQISGSDNPKHQKYKQRISQISNILDLDVSIKNFAQDLYLAVDDAMSRFEGQKARLKIDGLCAAVIFIASKRIDAPITFKELNRATTISEKDMKTAYKYIKKNLPQVFGSATQTVSTVESLVRRYSVLLGIPKRTVELCVTVCNGAREHLEGKLPQTVAAAAMLLVVLNSSNSDRSSLPSLQQLADLTDLTAGTIQAACNELVVVKTSLFPASFKFSNE